VPAKLLAASTIERPRLTVMFCELVGPTARGLLDPKDLHGVIGA
jgi:hypothetical protein